MQIISENSSGTGIRARGLPKDYSLSDLCPEYMHSFRAYNGKEGLMVLSRNHDDATFRFSLPELLQIPVHYHDILQEDLAPIITTGPATSLSDVQQQTQENIPMETTETIVSIPNENIRAATTIARMWRTLWPLVQKRRNFEKSDLGRAAAAIHAVCAKIDAADLSNNYLKHTRALSTLGPNTYVRVCEVLLVGYRTAFVFKGVFAKLSKGGGNLEGEDLERIYEWSQKVNEYVENLERYKASMMNTEVIVNMSVDQLTEALISAWTVAEEVKAEFEDVARKLDDILVASRGRQENGSVNQEV